MQKQTTCLSNSLPDCLSLPVFHHCLLRYNGFCLYIRWLNGKTFPQCLNGRFPPCSSPKCPWLAWIPGNNPFWMADCLISSSTCPNDCLLPACCLLVACPNGWCPPLLAQMTACCLPVACPNGWFPSRLAHITAHCLLVAYPNGWFPPLLTQMTNCCLLE